MINTLKDIYVQQSGENKINFISNKKVTGNIIHLNESTKYKNFNGIICIENADPGYDFLFSKNIKGLITKYGGVNSHMSIRCHELNIPAAIGVGDETFDKIIEKNKLILNCKENKIYLD